MAFTKVILFQVMMLAAVHLLMAEDQDGLFGLPKFGPGAGMPDADMMQNFTGDKEGEEHENRFFFNLFSTLSTCNYTANPGRSCLGCRQAQTCLPSNVSIIRTCRGFFRFCNNGSCSLTPGANCTTSG